LKKFCFVSTSTSSCSSISLYLGLILICIYLLIIPYHNTLTIGNNEANAINQNQSIIGSLQGVLVASHNHRAATNGTVIVDVVTQPLS